MNIDIKSALIGLTFGVVAMLAIGASSQGSAGAGHYQVAGTASHAVIIDTATGQAWSAYLSQTGGKTYSDFWEPKADK